MSKLFHGLHYLFSVPKVIFGCILLVAKRGSEQRQGVAAVGGTKRHRPPTEGRVWEPLVGMQCRGVLRMTVEDGTRQATWLISELAGQRRQQKRRGWTGERTACCGPDCVHCSLSHERFPSRRCDGPGARSLCTFLAWRPVPLASVFILLSELPKAVCVQPDGPATAPAAVQLCSGQFAAAVRPADPMEDPRSPARGPPPAAPHLPAAAARPPLPPHLQHTVHWALTALQAQRLLYPRQCAAAEVEVASARREAQQ